MKDLKVLLVDDEEEFVTTLAERLRLRGINALTATDGQVALQLARAEQPHVVVLDVMMPGVGGMQVLKEMKKVDPQVQVILLTGRGSTKEGQEGMRLGAYDYLMKPLKIEELISKMEKARQNKAADRA
jgi:DNA-binding response OmpR family regulator